MKEPSQLIQELTVENSFLKQRIQSLERLAAEQQQAAEYIRKENNLSRILFDALPYPAMIVSVDRIVLAANKVSRGLGVTAGSFCWETFGKCAYIPAEKAAEYKRTGNVPPTTSCRFCRADRCLKDQKARSDSNVQMLDQTWDMHWIALDSKLFLHYALNITERKRLENQLISIMQAVESTSEAIGISDSRGRHFYQNRAMTDLFGYATAEELAAAGGAPALLKDQKMAHEMFADILHGASFAGEVTMITKNGRVFQAFSRADAVKNKEGELVGFVGLVTDITERIQAEALLRESEERFHALFEQASYGIFTLDITGKIISINETFARMHGFTREELLHVGLKGLDAKGRTPSQDGINRVLAGETLTFEVEHYHKDGHILPLLVTANLICSDKQKMIVAVHHDITERRRAEVALRASEERLRLITDNIPALIGYVDITDHYQFANKHYETWYGVKPEDLIGRARKDTISEELYKRHQPFIERALAGEELTFDGKVMLPSGVDRYYYTHLVPDRAADGSIRGCYVLVSDMTEKKKTDEAIARIDKLEAIGTLAAGIAHDFNNLLGMMFGYLELAQLAAENNKQREIVTYLTQARKAFDRSKDLTGQLLTFSKGGAPVRKTQSLSKHVKSTISFSLNGSKTTAAFTIPDNLWLSDFDENQLARVLDNIVINSCHAMPQGGSLDVSFRNISAAEAPGALPPRDYVRLTIRDYGTGIAPEHLPHIFEPFFSTKELGSGLGLATSYSIIRQHEGLIEVESVLGQGTAFHVYLPASAGAAAAVTNIQQAFHRGKGRILIMDDEEMLLEVLALTLENAGYEVIKAQHGEEAKKIMSGMTAAGKPFVAAILDLTIPSGLGGKDIVSALLAIDPQIKIIASSGYANDPVMSHPRDYGFAGCLFKPYLSADLLAALRSILTDPL